MIGLTAGITAIVGAMGVGFATILPMILIFALGPILTFRILHIIWQKMSNIFTPNRDKGVEVYDFNAPGLMITETRFENDTKLNGGFGGFVEKSWKKGSFDEYMYHVGRYKDSEKTQKYLERSLNRDFEKTWGNPEWVSYRSKGYHVRYK